MMTKMAVHEEIELLKQYLLMKFHRNDWHGVMDAAADLRELEIIKSIQDKFKKIELEQK